MTDRSPIDPSSRKRKNDQEPMSPVIKPTKRAKISRQDKLAVNGSAAEREKNADFNKRLKAGETSCKTRIWDKEVYLAERHIRSQETSEVMKILEDDPTQFEECFNESNKLSGNF